MLNRDSKHHVVIGTPVATSSPISSHILAWATDNETNRPVHISDLRRSQTGMQCSCKCPACGGELIAVNAGLAEWRRRPHFRHYSGVETDECAILAARHAALSLLAEEGRLTFPGTTVSGAFTGFSGQSYASKKHIPPFHSGIFRRSYVDSATAKLVLDDGKVVYVRLLGLVGDDFCVKDEAGNRLPTIFIDITSPELTSLSADKLLTQLRLDSDIISWRHHPNDASARSEADEEAKSLAIENLDFMEGLGTVPRALLSETVLHRTAKLLLADLAEITLPSYADAVGSSILATKPAHVYRATTSAWTIEQQRGDLIPDAICTADLAPGRPPEELRVEITVSNSPTESHERMEKIMRAQVATLEIDLRPFRGSITRDELRNLLIKEVSNKRWLFHPLQSTLKDLLPAPQGAAPISQLPGKASLSHCPYLAEPLQIDPDSAYGVARADSIRLAAYYRIPNAECFYTWNGILPTILSMKLGIGTASHEDRTVLEILKFVSHDRDVQQFHGLFIECASVYEVEAQSEENFAFVREWRRNTESKMRMLNTAWLHNPLFDRVVIALFPELTEGLARLGMYLPDKYTWSDSACTVDPKNYARTWCANKNQREPSAVRMMENILQQSIYARHARVPFSKLLSGWNQQYRLQGNFSEQVSFLRHCKLLHGG